MVQVHFTTSAGLVGSLECNRFGRYVQNIHCRSGSDYWFTPRSAIGLEVSPDKENRNMRPEVALGLKEFRCIEPFGVFWVP